MVLYIFVPTNFFKFFKIGSVLKHYFEFIRCKFCMEVVVVFSLEGFQEFIVVDFAVYITRGWLGVGGVRRDWVFAGD